MTDIPKELRDAGSEAFLVGDLFVDVGKQSVMRAGAEIALPNLSFQLLVALIRAAPNVLSHDMLMTRVWPGLIVSPETVIKRANLLREPLGDDAKEPRYIAAVRSRGYRLVAEVTRAERPPAALGVPAPDTIAAQPPADPPMLDVGPGEPADVPVKPRTGQWALLSITVVALIAAGIVARTYIKTNSESSANPPQPPQAVNAVSDTRARTVAVMPFDNISADAADAYLARGLPEMVLNRLSHVTGLAVIARTSSFALDTTRLDSREIGRRLNAGYLVNGSVQRKSDGLRATVQLVDTSAGTLIWSASFDRTLRDVFTVEDEISDQVMHALSAHVLGLTPAPAAQVRSNNVEAYLAYLHGRAMLGRRSVAVVEAAVPFFEKAIALDPGFAAAYASLYDAHLQSADLRFEDLAPVRQRFRPLIDKALALDPNSGSAYFARAMWAGASLADRDADFRRGVALDPSNGRALTAYAEFLYDRMQRPDEGMRMLQRALQVDPMSPNARMDVAYGGLAEGGAVLERNMQSVLEVDPEFVPALHQIGKYRWLMHYKLAESLQILEHAIALDPDNPWPRHTAMAVYLELGDEQAARAVAAGTPQSARSAGLLSLYAGDWRAAGRAAYGPAGWVYENCENWLASEALRDYAMKTGELSPAIALIKAKSELGDDPAANMWVCNAGPAIVLSQLMAAQGRASDARSLRTAALAWSNSNADKYADEMHRIRAGALLLDGQKDAALEELAASFRGGDCRFWWYILKYDPLWLPLHGDARFQAIADDVHHKIDGQRKELEDLRRRGVVPPALRPGDSARKATIK